MALFLFARFHARPGCRSFVEQAIAKVQVPTREEPGCLAYTAYRSIKDADEFFVHSTWRSQEDFQRHAQLAHVVDFITTIEPLVDHEIKVSLTEPLL